MRLNKLLVILAMALAVFTACEKEDKPPVVPSLLAPENNAEIEDIMFGDICFDISDESSAGVTYTLHADTIYPPQKRIREFRESEIYTNDFKAGKKYYWRILATSSSGLVDSSEIRTFTTPKSTSASWDSYNMSLRTWAHYFEQKGFTKINGDIEVSKEELDKNNYKDYSFLSNLEEIDFLIIENGVEDLSFLKKLQKINTGLYIKGADEIENLDFFESLEEVNGNLSIINNRKLSDLTILDKVEGDISGFEYWVDSEQFVSTNLPKILQSCTELNNLWISDFNGVINDLNMLSNLEVVHGDVEIDANNIDGLKKLNKIGGNASFRPLKSTTISDLNNLTTIGGDLDFLYSSLVSLDGLNNLKSVGGFLWIKENKALRTLDGLNNLETIGGELSIVNNNTLMSLAGLENLTECTYLAIWSNDFLDDYCPLYKLFTSGKLIYNNISVRNNKDSEADERILDNVINNCNN
ncbi:receptor L domain-containing protein [Labilibacter marinus]|uniref:hypothetical protein n=1 Tax=Labilibacter marinus TaxID=1477105 RepID=UPI00082C651D|nr:hypothetical protein [Labilibacter marinus]